METYTLEDFRGMKVGELFGFWCLSKLDGIELAEPRHYTDIYRRFMEMNLLDICEYLAAEGINKPIVTNQGE